MKNKMIMALIILACIHSNGRCCDTPPLETHISDAELVRATSNIYLVEIVSSAPESDGYYQIYTGKVIQVLKGSIVPSVVISGGMSPRVPYVDATLGNHRSVVFKRNINNNERIVARSLVGPDCRVRPIMYIGKKYLVFMNQNHRRAYEEVVTYDDSWLKRVRKLIAR